MKKLIVVSLLALLALPAVAQAQRAGNFTYKYDVASSSATYCAVLGRNGSSWLDPIVSSVPIETSGSSTTVSAVTAGTNPFTNLVAGDVILVSRDNGARDVRVVTAKASADEVTVETAVDWSAEFPFSWLNNSCGTGAEDGWISVDSFTTVQMTVQYDGGDLDTLDVQWFCRESALGSNPVRVYPGTDSDCGDGTLSGVLCTYSSPGAVTTVKINSNVFSECRIGLKYGSTDGGTRESVTATVSGR